MKCHTGFSLLEVLIALLILTITLLGFSQTGLLALRDQQAAYFRTVANIQISSMAEHLLICADLHAQCLANAIQAWQAETKQVLPRCVAKIENYSGNYLIGMQWNVSETSRLQVQQ